MNDRPNPYVGPRPLTEGERLYGRSRELRRLTNLLLAERIVLLYSPSGAGKTSLIQAGLIPELTREGFRIFGPMRPGMSAENDQGDGNRYVAAMMTSLEPETMSGSNVEPTAGGSADILPTPISSGGVSLLSEPDSPAEDAETNPWTGDLLIFDQFEEVLLADPADHAGRMVFFEELGTLLRDRNRWALFAMREEHLAALDPYRRPIPTHFNTTFRLDLLSLAEAQEAIRGPAESSGVTFPEDIALDLAKDLARVRRGTGAAPGGDRMQVGQWVEPVQLQVVCQRIWEELDPAETSISLSHLTEIGDVDTALREYYAASVAKAAKAAGVRERALREWLGAKLITESGARNQVLWEPTTEPTPQDKAFDALVDAHLLRAEQRRDALWLELAHDRLVRPVLDDNIAWLQKHLQPFQHEAREWEHAGRPAEMLLRGQALVAAEEWAGANATELMDHPGEAQYLQQSRAAEDQARSEAEAARRARNLRLRTTVAVTIAVLVGLAALAALIVTQNNNRRSAALAESRSLAARSGLALQGGDYQLAAMLASEAFEQADTPEARGSLLAALSPERRPANAFTTEGSAALNAVAFSPDGEQLAAVSDDGNTFVWERATHNLRFTIDSADELRPQHVTFSPDSQILAIGYDEGQVELFDVTGSTPQRVGGGATGESLIGLVMGSQNILYTADKETIAMWRIEESGEIQVIASRGAPDVRGIALSPDGARLATGHGRGNVWEWGILPGQAGLSEGPSSVLEGPPQAVRTIAIGWDGTVAAGYQDGQVVYWPPPEAADRRYQLIGSHEREVTGLSFAPQVKQAPGGPDEQYEEPPLHLASSGRDRQVILWDVTAANKLMTWRGHSGFVNAVSFSPDGESVVSAGEDGRVLEWLTNLGLRKPKGFGQVLLGHTDEVYSVAFNPNVKAGRLVATGSRDGEIWLWAPDAPDQSRVLATGLPSQIRRLAINDDGSRLAAVDGDGVLRVWSLESQDPPLELVHADGKFLDAVLFLGDVVITAGDDSAIKVWQVDQPVDPATPPLPLASSPVTDSVRALALVPSSGEYQRFAALTLDGMITFYEWRLRDQALVAVDATHVEIGGDQASALAVSPDGARLAVGAGNGPILMRASGGEVTLLQGHINRVQDLAFSPDGRMLASAGVDGVLRVWDVESGQPLGTPLRSAGLPLNSVAFSTEGRWLAATCDDGSLILYPADPAEWLALLQTEASP